MQTAPPVRAPTMDDRLCFVQFLHPGKEHSPDDGSLKSWNRAKHKRKFLDCVGRYVVGRRVEAGRILLWGEWEPESTVAKIDFPIDGGPHFIHEPYYVLPALYTGLRNTDPFVFGERFHYAICRQLQFRQLRHLAPGSVILFGSCKDGSFALDTVFVVNRGIPYTLPRYEGFLAGVISQAYEEVTMRPLCEEFVSLQRSRSRHRGSCAAAGPEETLRFYIGATRDRDIQGMYSFFPCQPYEEGSRGFPRPTIELPQIASRQTQGIKVTFAENLDEMKELWSQVVGKVQRHKRVLGVYARMPEHHLSGP
jgi:hypothetical protein